MPGKLPATAIMRGPDSLRGPEGYSFIYAPYTNRQGKQLFVHKGGGHEHFTADEEVVEALFGPELDRELSDEELKKYLGMPTDRDLRMWEKSKFEKHRGSTLRDILSFERDVYDSSGATPTPTGEKVKEYDRQAVRRLTQNKALYGRYGKLFGKDVIMLWPGPKNWQPMLVDLLRKLDVDRNDDQTIVTIGTDVQFTPKEFFDNFQGVSKAVDSHVEKDRDRLKLLAQYHAATGAEKERLGKMLGIHKPGVPDISSMSDQEKSNYPWKRQHWRVIARDKGLTNVFDYGEGIEDEG